MGIKIALAGNPNCGKTTLFNALTGSNQFVGNWPGVTVEKKEGKLKDDVLQYLGEGYRVELGEFGFFSAKVKASRLVANKNDIRSESVAFNGVNFRASKSMRVGIRGDLERRKCVDFNTSRKWGRDNLKKLVLQYIGEHGFITRATYTQLTGRLKNTALDDLKSFAAEGIIKREGRGNQMHFIAPPRKEPDGE